MCNLYEPSNHAAVEAYLADQQLEFELPGFDVARPVGPRGTGLFVRADGSKRLRGQMGQWGMIRPKSPAPKPGDRPYQTNNARIESIAEKPTYRHAWRAGQRCLIPAAWYAEPNWQTGKNIWWHLRRADGRPWWLAGLWDAWTNPETGEIIPNYTMITCNCDSHPLLNRLHKPDPQLPPDKQDKRAVVHIDSGDWYQWLYGTQDEALQLIRPQAQDVFDQADALRTDQILATQRGSGSLF